MNTKINFTYKDIPYVLEYDRNSIIQMEASGLVISEFLERPITNIQIAFAGAFLKNHKKTATNQKLVTEIYDLFENKEELISTLVTMIGETYDSLLGDKEDDNTEGKIKWGTSGLN